MQRDLKESGLKLGKTKRKVLHATPTTIQIGTLRHI